MPLETGNHQSKKTKKIMALNHAPDLTQRPPRSPRVRLGGYAILPRMLDKGRATINGKNGEYHYNCPLDQRFLGFVGIDADKLKKELAAGKGDGEILEWIQKNGKPKPFGRGNQNVVGLRDRARAGRHGVARIFQRDSGQDRAEAGGHRDVVRPAWTLTTTRTFGGKP